MSQSSYQLLNLTLGITHLSWPFSFNAGPYILDINDINPDAGGQSLQLPNALLANAGQNFIINNISGFSFNILANDGTTVITTVASGDIVQLYLIQVDTNNGTWRVIPFGGGTAAITQFTAESTDSSIIITNGVVTSPTGVINFQLPESIENLNTLANTGFLVVTGVSPLTFGTVTLLSTSNLTIANPDGITNGNVADPVFDLSSSSIGPISSIEVGDMVLTGEVISNTTTNKNIQLSSTGTGSIQLNGVNIDANGNISGITNFVAPKAFCVFTDTISGTSNTIVVQDETNVSGVTGSAGTYVISFTTPMDTTNYGVVITMGTTEGSLPFISTGYFLQNLRTESSVTIIVTDASGQLVLSAPNGISIMIMST